MHTNKQSTPEKADRPDTNRRAWLKTVTAGIASAIAVPASASVVKSDLDPEVIEAMKAVLATPGESRLLVGVVLRHYMACRRLGIDPNDQQSYRRRKEEIEQLAGRIFKERSWGDWGNSGRITKVS